MKEKKNWKKVFTSQEIVSNYDLLMKIWSLKRNERINMLVKMIPIEPAVPIQILELGSGIGSVTKKLLRHFPKCRVTCIEGSDQMFDRAQKELQSFADRLLLLRGDFGEKDWVRKLIKDKTYDLVVSVDAIHHLSHDGKKELYQKIYHILTANGLFFLSDHICSHHVKFQEKHFNIWVESVRRNRKRCQNVSLSFEEIKRQMIRNIFEFEGDNPAPLLHQLGWLRDVGFSVVDCVYRYSCFAIMAAQK